ncbi:hypothetical protein GPECTOR_15g351 [Gonium pectorale]|uniref:Uncharacterized protein n=1 Tax=Gonium pectorale TaxID=33097 RepID=A0A150GLK1_GONPE|nr:hypothetical protein GPECTOR_15g351 [Gonium pectorale]|eukprot:KXZ50667.1 hypothetical protein GPECTOR_15g351 [Gonium pectorale]
MAYYLSTGQPVLALGPGQQLTMTALSLNMRDVVEPLGPLWSISLPTLAPPRIFRVPVEATLVLQDVTIIVMNATLQSLFLSLCSSTDRWPYTPGVSLIKGAVVISSHDSHARGPDGSPGGGGVVRWRNVTITCPDETAVVNPKPGLRRPYPCSAAAVTGGDAGELRAASAAMLRTTQGPVYLAVTGNTSLAPNSGSGGSFRTVIADV